MQHIAQAWTASQEAYMYRLNTPQKSLIVIVIVLYCGVVREVSRAAGGNPKPGKQCLPTQIGTMFPKYQTGAHEKPEQPASENCHTEGKDRAEDRRGEDQKGLYLRKVRYRQGNGNRPRKVKTG